ncbi:MAG: hypothetical protein QUS08_10195, partial [Methanothrix sp.]|nr:hypothetical protein [Methanothrix sp.]
MKETSELTYERRPAESQCPGGKVALIYTSFAPFVARDHDLLSKHLDVENVSFAGMRDAPRILSAVKRSDVAISWFAGGHAALAVAFSRLLDRGSIVIVGGYDVARVPEIDYGQFSMGWRQRAQARMALAWADKVLVVDPSLKEDAIKNAGVDGRNIEYLPTGYDPARFRPGGKKEDLAIIVGTDMSETVIKRKGLATFVKAASYLPEVQFAVIGRPKDGS